MDQSAITALRLRDAVVALRKAEEAMLNAADDIHRATEHGYREPPEWATRAMKELDDARMQAELILSLDWAKALGEQSKEETA